MTIGTSEASATLTFKGSNYMVVAAGNQCTSLFRGNTALDGANYWLMGMPAYRAFEITHDLTNLKMGFRTSGVAIVTPGLVAENAIMGFGILLSIISMGIALLV